MGKFLKAILEYIILIIIGLGAGYGYLNYSSVSEKKATETIGDYSSYFNNNTTNIIMLGTSWCPSCKKLRNYLDENNASYKEYDIEQSKIGAKLFKMINGNAVPILITKSLKIIGLPKQNRLDEIINNDDEV